MPNPHLHALETLYKAFDHFNAHFYDEDRRLPYAVINLGPAGRKQALGWFRNNSWIPVDSADGIHEINISPEYLDRDPDQILETLLHEMAHMRNRCDDIADCNKAQYHNKHFKTAAEFLGLEVEKKGYRGYAWTSLGPDAKAAIDAIEFDLTPLKLPRPAILVPSANPYITITLKKNEYEEILDELCQGTLSKSELVKALVDQAYQQFTTKNGNE